MGAKWLSGDLYQWHRNLVLNVKLIWFKVSISVYYCQAFFKVGKGLWSKQMRSVRKSYGSFRKERLGYPSEVKIYRLKSTMLNWPPKVFHRNDHRAPSELRNSSFSGDPGLWMFHRCSELDFQPGHIKVGFAYMDSGIPYLNENLSYRLSSD